MTGTAAATDVARWLRAVLPAGAALVADSRAVAAGDAFFAYPGERADGRLHVEQAIARGAAALVVEAGAAGGWRVPHREVVGLKRLAGPIADAFHDAPSARLDVVAVTGTNGKTSCSHWIAQGLQAPGRDAAVIGTIGAGRAGALADVGLTTPDALSLQALFARFASQGVRAVAIEASSIGLHQHRLAGTRVAVAAFTNLTRDHLDYHGSMDEYARAKALLFSQPGLRAAVVNLDDPWHATMLGAVEPGVRRIGTTIAGGAADDTGGSPACELVPTRVERVLRAVSIETRPQGMRIELDGDWGAARVETPMLGRFNASNLLVVAASWLALDRPFAEVVERLGRLRPVPGRLQPVAVPGGAPAPLAVVDYAHTPDALASALQALRPVAAARGGRLWCVFGAGGDRDPGKRPLMGAVAERGADRVVLTSDNPRGERPEAILDAIEGGFSHAPALREVDRARAIAAAIGSADAADVVLIAGKGHESYQEIAGVRRPFDDAEHAARALAARTAPREAAGA
ncbi:MAG TPA: UDP-N-acetylmuramoyl-L-alanyl-D-glutamate--2,6-diaminopimelate ligase [Burkholderiaceae bacterium]|nr:UDP-N-acetylmuramoyl-L-alanyl-D-glutamate--2,6-diaminopimelate ligase [Burkholderiaceae bacterium]